MQDYQIVDAPSWFSTKRYDITAKVEGSPPTQHLFLQTLLKDQFRLKVQNETRELPAFALTVKAANGKPGPDLHRSDFDCDAYLAAPHALPGPGDVSPCSARITRGVLSAKSIPVSQLAINLAPFAGRFVVDRTGLAGRFDVELKWTPDDAAADTTGPSLFTAIEEQLGLTLMSIKASVDVLVVDHAEEPARE